ncbi:MAG: hypothetical protein NW216_04055 [Hyphomicrobium sp.]|nr:hypothetical protein [Hyphomicrobium sp.]
MVSGDRPGRTAILVLGMHRSGTSALTRVLSLLGAALPKHVLGAGPGNETGHWEPELLVSLHDRMLTEAGSSWDDWRKLDLAAQLPAGRLDFYRSEIARLIVEEYGDAPLIVLKDPRICRFVALYRGILEGLGYDVRPVLMVRSPLEVAASLAARDGLSAAQSQLYWLRHVLDAEAATRDLKRAVLTYDGLLADWRGEIARLDALGIAWPREIAEIAGDVEGFLSPGVRYHAEAPPGDGGNALTRWLSDVWTALATHRADTSARDAIDPIAAIFEPAAEAFAPALAEERGRREEIAADATRAREECDKERARVDSLDATLKDLEQRNAEMLDIERTLRRKADEAATSESSRANSLASDLAQANADLLTMSHRYAVELEATHLAYQNSTSWHVTRPLRYFKLMLEREARIREIAELSRRAYRALPVRELTKRRFAQVLRSQFPRTMQSFGLATTIPSSIAAPGQPYPIQARTIDGQPSGPSFIDSKKITTNKRTNSDLRDVYMVIGSYDGRHHLERLLPTIDLTRKNIIIADVNSNDGTRDFCTRSGCDYLNVGRPSSFVQTMNAGIRHALHRGAKYVVISNNDIVFNTPVVRQLYNALRSSQSLGIVAPTQILASRDGPIYDIVKYGCRWDLSTLSFTHICTAPDNHVDILDVDFCEFTLAMLPKWAFEAIGYLDPTYEFYHEDVDYCFRLFSAGYRCAYVQRAQITHFEGSSAAGLPYDKAKLIERNKNIFAAKHFARSFSFPRISSPNKTSWTVINENLHPALLRHGLLQPREHTEHLLFGHPDSGAADVLFTVWETTKIPHLWVKRIRDFGAVVVPSYFNLHTFRECTKLPSSGVEKIFYAPLGVDIDLFRPAGGKFYFGDRRFRFLCIFRDQYRKAFDVTLRAWDAFVKQNPDLDAELVVYATDFSVGRYGLSADCMYYDGRFFHRVITEQRIRILDSKSDLSYSDMARLYRSVDCTFLGVGDWWEPDVDELVKKLSAAARMGERERATLTNNAREFVLSQYTWRQTVAHLHRVVNRDR